MIIELTEEQGRALQAEAGRPLAVVDPATKQAYVIVALEKYERVRSLFEGAEQSAQLTPVSSSLQAEKPERVRLSDLSTPPEVVAETERCCQRYGWKRQQVEEELKLQYYYGGQAIYVLRTSEGPIVIPITERYKDTPDLRHILFTPEERSLACLEIPSRWREQDSEILI
jgi:hypothetical protein